ncbi:MAG: hypothetical protein QG641_969, partial [Candidatus Poribacteria bacterium]|nr:hypothetical protein [Candidatus Poribacteria bacterium]
MNNNSESQEIDQKKNESILLSNKGLYAITIDKIKDPIQLAPLAGGTLIVTLAIILKGEIPKFVIWILFL